jgi:transposase InsO family protein
VTNDDLIYRHRLQLFSRAAQVGVSRACRELGFHRSTYYHWKPLVERHGLVILRPRERRPPRMPNQIPNWLEQKIVAVALGEPGLGPRRIAAQLEHTLGERVSGGGVFNVLRRAGLSTRRKRLALVAGYAAPPQPERLAAAVEPHIDAGMPGDVLQLDCFHIGRLAGTAGRVWQYTATDVVSGYLWAELYVSPLNPKYMYANAVLRTAASELARAGWRLKVVTTDNGGEFRALPFRATVAKLGAEHRFIHAGRPQTNGCVERVQRTILEECWRPAFARSLVPDFTSLRRDLARYLHYFNEQRAHIGRHTRGRTPWEVVYGSRKMHQ